MAGLAAIVGRGLIPKGRVQPNPGGWVSGFGTPAFG